MNKNVSVNGPEKMTLEMFRQQVLPPERANDLWKSLPAHIKPAVFERNLINALMQNQGLMRLPAHLVYREVSKAAALGLLLDPLLGEAYIVLVWNGRRQRQEPQLRVGYRGLLKLARQAGDVEAIYAHEVCANDLMRCELGTEKKLLHEPKLFGDRGPVIGYYAVIKHKDGGTDFEPMSREQVLAIRDRSEGWKAYQAQRVKTTPWLTDEDEMAKKTVLRRLMKRVPQSPELQQALNLEDEAEFPDMRNVTPQAEEPPAPRAILAPKDSSQMTDQDYVDLVESGRHPPETEEDFVWGDEEPPQPRQAAPPANTGPNVNIKQGLLTEIARASSPDLDRILRDPNFRESLGKLSGPEQTEVNTAWMHRKYEIGA